MAEDVAARLAGLDFASVTPQEFAGIVKSLSAKEIAQVARGELRARVLGEIFGRMERQFCPENARGLRALIRWRITGESDVDYETTIEDGTCSVRRGWGEGAPRVTFTLRDAEFLKLVSGNSSPVTMFLTRKVKVTGDLSLAASLTRLFDIPKP